MKPKFIKFRHQAEMSLAMQFGAKFKNFTPDSCDLIFPDKKSMDSFEEARKEEARKLYDTVKNKS